MNTKDLLEKHGNKFARLVRDLRIDFAKGEDEKDIEDPEILIVHKLLSKETFAMSYLPAYDYGISTLYQKEGILGDRKRLCYIVYPTNAEYIKLNSIVPVLEISDVDLQGEVKKTICYYAGFSDDGLEIVKKNEDNPQSAKHIRSIPFKNLENLEDEHKDLF